jgi:hypothetical protein
MDATEMLVRSMYEMKAAAKQRMTTVYHDLQRGRTSAIAIVTAGNDAEGGVGGAVISNRCLL